MHLYDFDVLRDGAVIAARRAVGLPDTRAAWPLIAGLAKSFDEPGYRIRVLDESGRIVILIGVVLARRHAFVRAA